LGILLSFAETLEMESKNGTKKWKNNRIKSKCEVSPHIE
jgi:hypothetical protein